MLSQASWRWGDDGWFGQFWHQLWTSLWIWTSRALIDGRVGRAGALEGRAEGGGEILPEADVSDRQRVSLEQPNPPWATLTAREKSWFHPHTLYSYACRVFSLISNSLVYSTYIVALGTSNPALLLALKGKCYLNQQLFEGPWFCYTMNNVQPWNVKISTADGK